MDKLEQLLSEDQKELLKLFNENGVEYAVTGAVGLAWHGYVRDTQDLDLVVSGDDQNLRRYNRALRDFFGEHAEYAKADDSLSGTTVITFGVGEDLTDIHFSLDGVNFEEVQAGQDQVEISENLTVPFIGYEELVKNKKAADRLQDRADVDELEGIHEADENPGEDNDDELEDGMSL